MGGSGTTLPQRKGVCFMAPSANSEWVNIPLSSKIRIGRSVILTLLLASLKRSLIPEQFFPVVLCLMKLIVGKDQDRRATKPRAGTSPSSTQAEREDGRG